ncbi:MAG: hypothetical protein AB8G77_18835 [Rhodothermales bacterium]
MNPSDDWIFVKARQFETRSAAISNGIGKQGCTKRAKHLFSGIIK